MPDPKPLSNQQGPPEARFLAWLDAFIDPATAIPVPDPDLAEVAGTAAFVQRTAGIGGAMSPMTDRTESMWEEIMQTTTMTPQTYPTLPRSDVAPPSGSPRSVSLPATGWRSYLATAVLIAAIVAVSAYTVWRLAGPFQFGGDGPEQASQPGIAGPATPATESPDGCPLTSDVPVFIDETTENLDALGVTYALVEPDSDFVIACPAVDDPQPLVTEVTNAEILPWPGTVMLELAGGDAFVYNVATNQRIELGRFDVVMEAVLTETGSPWMLTPANEARTDWRITNLKTMRTMLLSDELGYTLPVAIHPSTIWRPGAPAAIISPISEGARLAAQPNAETSGMPGGLVLDETLRSRRWIDIRGQAAISPDGDAIAYQTQVDTRAGVRVDDTETGESLLQLNEIEFNGPPGQRFVFAGDGETLVYLSDDEVWEATYGNSGAMPEPVKLVETGEMRPYALYSTGVPGRVLIDRITDNTIGTVYPSDIGGAKALSIFDVATGEVNDVAGLHPTTGSNFSTSMDMLKRVVTLAPSPDSESETVAMMTDIATGEVLLTSAPMRGSLQTFIDDFAWVSTSLSGAVTVVSVQRSETVLFDVSTGTVAPISMESLTGEALASVEWHVAPSTDGRHLYAFGVEESETTSAAGTQPPRDPVSYFAIAPVSIETRWSPPIESQPAGIIFGVPSDNSSGEPAVLEAQEFPSPVATPATPVATTPACGLTQDIPVFVDTVPVADFIETFVLLDDQGTLTLNCDDASETIATGVDQVVPTFWPGSIALALEDGTVQLMNLTNGATVHIEAEAVPEALSTYGGNVEVYIGAPHSPWLISVANPERTDWRITDLRTMESILLSEEIGGVLAEPRQPVFGSTFGWQLAIPNANDVAVISLISTYPTTPSPDEEADAGSVPVPADALVLPGSLEDRRWINKPTAEGPIVEAVSADGSLLAYITTSDDDEPMIRVEQTLDGEIVAEVPIEARDEDGGFSNRSLLLAGSEPRIVYTNGTSVEIVALDPESARVTIRREDGLPLAITSLMPTSDPNIVLVGDGNSTVRLNVATGTVRTPFQYVAYLPRQLQLVDGANHLVTIVHFASDALADVPATIQILDPVTGAVLIESDPIDVHPVELKGNNIVFLARHGTLAVVPIDSSRAVVLDVTSGETWEISQPIDGVEQWIFIPSQDGRLLYATSYDQYINGGAAPFYMAEAVTAAEWIEVGADSIPRYIVGTHDISGDDENALAELETQESPTPEAPPAASPATVAAAPACDLSGNASRRARLRPFRRHPGVHRCRGPAVPRPHEAHAG